MLRGWVDLTSDKPHAVKKSIKYLDQGTQDTRDVLGLMGKVGSGEGQGAVSPTGPLEPETLQVTSGWSPRRRGAEAPRGQGPTAPQGPPALPSLLPSQSFRIRLQGRLLGLCPS